MPAQLLALNEGPSILLDKPILLLGRDLECDIRLDSRKISRRHCCIALVGERLLVRDLGSTNGVRVNGVRVVEGQLKAGDELMIGNYRYRILWEAVAAAADAGQPELAKPPAASRRPPNEDELLEECEEPVALPDPSGAPVAVPIGKALGPPPPAEEPENILDVASAISPRTPYAPLSAFEPILPPDLELAPSSEELPPAAAVTNHHQGKPTMTPGTDSKKSWSIPPSNVPPAERR